MCLRNEKRSGSSRAPKIKIKESNQQPFYTSKEKRKSKIVKNPMRIKKGSCCHICDFSYGKIKLYVIQHHLPMQSQRNKAEGASHFPTLVLSIQPLEDESTKWKKLEIQESWNVKSHVFIYFLCK